MKICTMVLAGLLMASAAAGCNKTEPGTSATPSGALTADEKDLLSHLPAGALAVFGGNPFALRRWIEDSQVAGALGKPLPAFSKMWDRCLAKQEKPTAGSLALENGAPVLRMFIKGLTIAALEECAEEAMLTGTKDADGKGFTIELPQHDRSTRSSTYLAVDGGVYLRQALSDLREIVAYRGPAAAVTRAQLEADVAALAKGNAASEGKFDSLLAKVDRRKTLWFASGTAGTSAAATFKQVYGSLSFHEGLGAELIAQTVKEGAASDMVQQYRRGMEQLRNASEELAPLKETLSRISLVEADNTLRLALALDEQQLAMLLMAATAARR